MDRPACCTGLIAGFVKLAKEAPFKPITLQPHQLRVHERLKRAPGVLAYHGLGSGKSLTAISAGDALDLDTEAVVPAALRPNYHKELAKFRPQKHTDVKSYEGFSSDPKPHGKLLVFDEIQRLQDPNSRRSATAMEQSPHAAKRLGLSATPIQNTPEEIAPVINTVAGKRVLPLQQGFRDRYVGEETVKPKLWDRLVHGVQPGVRETIKNKGDFARKVRGLVDYHPPKAEGFPRSTHTFVRVPMSRPQHTVYKHVAGDMPKSFFRKMERNLPPSKRESANLNAFLTGVRIVSNTPAPYQDGMQSGEGFARSPKMQRVVQDIQAGVQGNPRHKSLVYSNFLEGGVLPIATELQRLGISHHVFTGGLSDRVRKERIDDYNAGRVKALLISGAGAEGLDLKGTRAVHVMEPHWNQSRGKQVIGRAIRYQSHAHLPPDEQHVDVRHYHSTVPQGGLARLLRQKPKTGADDYLYGRAEEKQQLNDQFLQVLQSEGSRPVEQS